MQGNTTSSCVQSDTFSFLIEMGYEAEEAYTAIKRCGEYLFGRFNELIILQLYEKHNKTYKD